MAVSVGLGKDSVEETLMVSVSVNVPDNVSWIVSPETANAVTGMVDSIKGREIVKSLGVTPAISISSEKITSILVGEDVTAFENIGEIPSSGVTLSPFWMNPITSVTELTRLTSGVSSVPIGVPKLRVTTPPSSVAPITVFPATVKSDGATVDPSKSVSKITSIVVDSTVTA